MKVKIISIQNQSSECVQITANVYWRGLPKPNYADNETDEQYANRVATVAKELESYENLHLGWAELSQEIISNH